MLIVLASRLAGADPVPSSPRRRHVNESSCLHRTAFFCCRPATPLPSSNAEGAPPFQCFLLLFVGAGVDRPHLAEVDPAPLSHLRGKQCQYQYGHGSIPVLGINRCPYRYWDCRDGVHLQYGRLPSARTSLGNAAMKFISSSGTCQVPVPVLALPRWSSFPVRALGKCLYQYWHGYSLPKLVNSIVLWKNCDKKENTSEFEYGYQYRYCAAPYRYW